MRSFVVLLVLAGSSSGFTPVQTPLRPPTQLAVSPIIPETVDTARTAFFIWFFGASGAAGIARSAFPRMYDSVREIQSLKNEGPTLGGETLGLSPLAGYPRDLFSKDVEAIVNNRMSVEQIVDKFPIENNFLSAKGYLTYAAFQKANAKANPLTIRAVFDTFAQSTDVVDPRIAQEKLDSYKADINAVSGALLKAKLIGFMAIATLLFLLGFADIVAAGHAYHGWFPDWPGAEKFPLTIFDKDAGLLTIPQYWLGDYESSSLP